MKLSALFDKVLACGIDADPRLNKKTIASYADTALLYGDPDRDIRKILVGIDIDVAELLLADRIRHQRGLDLVISHHPQGAAYANLANVMQVQVDLLSQTGLSRTVAQRFLDERKREVDRRIMSGNHTRATDAAALLDMPFMCVHTPADNQVSAFLTALVRERKPGRLRDIVDMLLEIPEYQMARDRYAGPRILLGGPDRQPGKVFIEMTGGTEGPKEVYDSLYRLGVRTLVSMHLSEEHFKKVRDVGLNVIIAGHISSDVLGLNLLLDKIEACQKMSILSCSGFARVRRNV